MRKRNSRHHAGREQAGGANPPSAAVSPPPLLLTGVPSASVPCARTNCACSGSVVTCINRCRQQQNIQQLLAKSWTSTHSLSRIRGGGRLQQQKQQPQQTAQPACSPPGSWRSLNAGSPTHPSRPRHPPTHLQAKASQRDGPPPCPGEVQAAHAQLAPEGVWPVEEMAMSHLPTGDDPGKPPWVKPLCAQVRQGAGGA